VNEAHWDCVGQSALHNLVIDGEGEALAPNELYRLTPILKDELKGTCGMGRLTKEGYKQHLRLGEMLRHRYVESSHFLAETFDQSCPIYVRSTDYARTIASVQALLTGLYPIEKRQSGENGQFSIHMRASYMENLYPRIDKTEMKNLAKKIRESHEKISVTGFPRDVLGLVTTLESLTLHGHTVPELPEGVTREDVEDLAAKYEGELFGNERFAKLCIGNFATELFDGFDDREKKGQFRIVSAHDTTLAPLLGVLGAIGEDGKLPHPPCGSSVILELWRNPQAEDLVHILYNSEPLFLPAVPAVQPGWYRYQDLKTRVQPFLQTDEEFLDLVRNKSAIQ
jgi:hypothetical protein